MKKLLSLVFILSIYSAAAQKPERHGWHLLDPKEDGYLGISLDKAYGLLKGKKSTTVIVAVIDSGIDTTHEDLKPVLWTNPREIAGNGKDDDGNGYTDDVHGWNFCGSRSGENLARNTYEVQRVYHGWKGAFEGKKEKDISPENRFLYSQWQRARTLVEKDYKEASKELPRIQNFENAVGAAATVLISKLGTKDFSAAQVKPLQFSQDPMLARAAELWTNVFGRSDDSTIRNTAIMKEVTDYKTVLQNRMKRKTEKPEDWRGALVQDNYHDINDRFYGNNNLKSGSGDHGTSVAGVVGAARGNGKGVDGIADNVRIMAVRAVPGGDEHDKDVALAIRYAVDNGASIINMSFGKPVSPYKHLVDSAILYAASKGVLLVHGSGNDGQDLSQNPFYPSPFLMNGKRAENMITVGASGDSSTVQLAAPFSNYGKEWVDIFAPGMYIYSTATDNRYTAGSGTSLASPVVAGVAALLRSYFPRLTPETIISILKESGTPVAGEVLVPGTEDKKAPFGALSSSGRVINAYEAVKLALKK